MLIREKYPDMEVTICYMDVRAYGKGYEEYYQRAIRAGVRFLRGMPAEILGHGNEIEIRIEDSETGALETLHPGLVVLSVGLEPADAGELAACLGVPLENSGFYRALHDKVDTVGTIRPGIYIAGTGAGPKDIPDCVAQGGAAAMRAFIDSVKTGSTDE
jgi:heterodisulfide reductase subunit A